MVITARASTKTARLVIELLDLANAYFENQLKKRCIQIIKQGITVLNVAFLYSTAIENNAQVSYRPDSQHYR